MLSDVSVHVVQAAGIQDSTIRVAVGIEEQEDLIEDFRHSLSCVKS